jgi:predicted MFS family arabinose efflux permease
MSASALRSPVPATARLSPKLAYALSAAVIGFSLFASAIPSPLYATYSRLWGFSPFVVTLVYATYALGVLLALLLAGRSSDIAGRRPVLLVALGALIIASLLYMLAASVIWLFAARALQGVATGLALGTASAGLLDFHPRRDPHEVGLTNGSVSAAGLGLGALTSAAVVQLLPDPRVIPYAVALALFALAFLGALLMPEPVADRAPLRLAPQRPRVPAEVRPSFLLAALAAAAAYSIGGLFFALGPQLSAQVFATGNHLVTDMSLFLLAGVGAVAQLLYGRRSAWAGTAGGSVALAVGVGLIALAAAVKAPAPLLLGSAIGGTGFGLAFLGALRNLSAVIPPGDRAAVMSAFFLVAYSALSLPAVLAGAAVTRLGLSSTFSIFGAAVASLALVTALQAWRARPRPHPGEEIAQTG